MNPDLTKMFHLLVEGLDAIAAITTSTKDDDAAAALRAIGAAVGHIKSGAEGKVSADVVKQAIGDLRARLHGNDVAADIKLAEKFPG